MPYRLVVHVGDRSQRHPLGEGQHVVGSSPECEITIRHPTLSRRHARITVDTARVTIEDLGSTNGTRVAGRAVTDPVELGPESACTLGTVEVRLEAVSARYRGWRLSARTRARAGEGCRARSGLDRWSSGAGVLRPPAAARSRRAPETQAKILRVLQEHEVYRVGGHTPRPADVRVLAATNRDIDAMIADGSFRSDLYHRIADWVVQLPPLRARRADIPNLAAHFLASAAADRGIHAAGISRSAVEALVAYGWPGNVRQLEREIGRAALFLENGELLDTSRLQPRIAAARESVQKESLKEALARAEREHITAVLGTCNGAVAAAAERLQIGLSTLYRRMKALGIE